MHINVRSPIPAILPPTSNVSTDTATQSQDTQGNAPVATPGVGSGAANGPDRSPPVFAAKLSADDLDTLQSVDNAGHGKSASSPAHQARAFIADHPEFADMPFGRVVSQFAHGETPVVDTSGDVTTPPADSTDTGTPTDTGSVTPTVDGSTPPTDTSSDIPPTDTSTSPTDVSTDVPATDTPTDAASNPPTDTSTDTASDAPPTDGSLPSEPAPNVAVTNPDQALIDALT